jgi:hypothetical protein
VPTLDKAVKAAVVRVAVAPPAASTWRDSVEVEAAVAAPRIHALDSYGGDTMTHDSFPLAITMMTMLTMGCAPVGEDQSHAPVPFSERDCPNPAYGCTNSNGTGVYHEELGDAFIGNGLRFMITHFTNYPNGVGFEGRYYNAVTQQWLTETYGPGSVSASYEGHPFLLESLAVSNTVPTMRLFDPSNNVHVSVTDSDLLNLTLTIELAGTLFDLGFVDHALESSVSPKHRTTVTKYHVKWHSRAEDDPSSGFYCTDAQGQPDAVVFQEGIDVNPVTGAVTANLSDVTISCRLGAPATVYLWGYDYVTDPFHFAAAIQMKRASYCADATVHTLAGTRIKVFDDEGVQQQFPEPQTLEAYWTPTGATCYERPRRLDLGARLFDGKCNGVALPTVCTPSLDVMRSQRTAFLADGEASY